MNITVYLGANEGNDNRLREAVQALGHWVGESGNALVYGGSKTGLMGELAKAVLEAGGKVTGVEPQFFMEMCIRDRPLGMRLLHFRAAQARWRKFLKL